MLDLSLYQKVHQSLEGSEFELDRLGDVIFFTRKHVLYATFSDGTFTRENLLLFSESKRIPETSEITRETYQQLQALVNRVVNRKAVIQDLLEDM
jgi:hypothetical protein